ncbi:PREDICTED: protein N-terminal glutamine amidohydrolase-like [Priapulus caudatus]|uniref:Protein N-terminal glutamine amidohydrolase n=1 Tax=Priapulus caudatus TaxID=37621 RepID=A0ABM1DST9_PRICU|nr:PREDICTED: protein N-terminal glutamine amidohydrolase-like [Priapulus caudatus]XP_014663011.1 PREDICTED: protein N-terminal glutamine amidohydrolase-like [Priapulus caudatus]
MSREISFLPEKSSCVYTQCYCEENVWKMCECVKLHQPDQLDRCHAVFISNTNKTVPLWMQVAASNPTKPVVWDYHVIFVYKDCVGCLVYDLDTVLPFPYTFRKYASQTFRSDLILLPDYHRLFRVVPARVYLEQFASDRSHMLASGEYQMEPPDYPCIQTTECSNNLADFISMKEDEGCGEVMNLVQFLHTFSLPHR